MGTDDIVRWGLHELEGSGYFANAAGSSDVKPLHEVSSQGRVENNVENRSSGVQPAIELIVPVVERRVEVRSSDIKPVNEVAQPRVVERRVEIRSCDIIPVNDFGEPIVERVRATIRYSEPPLISPPNTANDAVIAQALHEEFQKLAAAEAAGQACKEKV